MRDSADGKVRQWYRGKYPVTGFLLRVISPGGAGVREGIGVGDDGVLVRSRGRPDQWVPWSEIEKFEVTSRFGHDAILIMRSNAEPLLTCAFRSSTVRRRNAPTIRAYEIQHALEHKRVEAIRAARRSARD